MSVKIKRQILSQNAKNVPGRKMTPKYSTVHNTANTTKGANAKMHANYQSNGSGGRQASWHYQVDDKETWQSLEDNQQGWHAGDGGGKGNTQSIGIEICENSDGHFGKAVANAQKLIAELMKKHGIPIKNVVPHKHWSGKNCPRKLLGNWSAFIKGVEKAYNNGGSSSATPPASSKPGGSTGSSTAPASPAKNKLAVDGSWGPATTRALQDRFGTTVDGVISGQPNNVSVRNIPSAKIGTTGSNLIRAMQRHYKSGIVDGKISGTSNLITKMQRKFGLSIVDGKVSNPSNLVQEIQRRVNAGTL